MSKKYQQPLYTFKETMAKICCDADFLRMMVKIGTLHPLSSGEFNAKEVDFATEQARKIEAHL